MTNIRHVGLVVSDINIAENLYSKILGFSYVQRKVETGDYIKTLLGVNVLTWAKYSKGDSILELYIAPALLKSCPSFNHIAFTVDDIDSVYNKVLKSGYYCLSKPTDNPLKTCKIFFMRDRDQNLLEIVQEKNAKKK